MEKSSDNNLLPRLIPPVTGGFVLLTRRLYISRCHANNRKGTLEAARRRHVGRSKCFQLLWPQPDWKWLEFANFLIQTLDKFKQNLVNTSTSTGCRVLDCLLSNQGFHEVEPTVDWLTSEAWTLPTQFQACPLPGSPMPSFHCRVTLPSYKFRLVLFYWIALFEHSTMHIGHLFSTDMRGDPISCPRFVLNLPWIRNTKIRYQAWLAGAPWSLFLDVLPFTRHCPSFGLYYGGKRIHDQDAMLRIVGYTRNSDNVAPWTIFCSLRPPEIDSISSELSSWTLPGAHGIQTEW